MSSSSPGPRSVIAPVYSTIRDRASDRITDITLSPSQLLAQAPGHHRRLLRGQPLRVDRQPAVLRVRLVDGDRRLAVQQPVDEIVGAGCRAVTLQIDPQ